MRFALVHAEKAHHSVSALCRVLRVSPSGYYAWAKRDPSKRARTDQLLVTHIRALHSESRGTYGSPRVHAALRHGGFAVARKRVARLMRTCGIVGVTPKRWRSTTDSEHLWPIAPNLLDRAFDVDSPDRAWVTDITYVWTWEGWLYLAIVLDLFSRRVVGWAAADHMRTGLVLDALGRALVLRQPGEGLLHHSDQGSQYASDDYQRELERRGIVVSMSRRGECYDNAVAESFFGTIKREMLDRASWPTRRSAHDAIAGYVDGFYNSLRLHSHLGYLSPVDFERRYHRGQACQAA